MAVEQFIEEETGPIYFASCRLTLSSLLYCIVPAIKIKLTSRSKGRDLRGGGGGSKEFFPNLRNIKITVPAAVQLFNNI